MSTDYYCSRHKCEHDTSDEYGNPLHWCEACQKCDWSWTSTGRLNWMAPSFSKCPACQIGDVMVLGKKHVPVIVTKPDHVFVVWGEFFDEEVKGPVRYNVIAFASDEEAQGHAAKCRQASRALSELDPEMPPGQISYGVSQVTLGGDKP